jgi:hypothetical protein
MRDHNRWPALFGQVGLRLIGMDARKVSFPVTSTARLINKVTCEISGETGTKSQMG